MFKLCELNQIPAVFFLILIFSCLEYLLSFVCRSKLIFDSSKFLIHGVLNIPLEFCVLGWFRCRYCIDRFGYELRNKQERTSDDTLINGSAGSVVSSRLPLLAKT